MVSSLRNIITILLFATFSLYTHAQETVAIDFDFTCQPGGTKIFPTEAAKSQRLSSNNSGNITIDHTDCVDMPDSLKVALKIASDIWSGYMTDNDALNIKINYNDINNVDIKTSVYYHAPYSSGKFVYYPISLYKKIFGERPQNAPDYDAIIHINKNTNWSVGIGNGNSTTSKNLSYALLRAIATAMGFGSSIHYDRRQNITFYFSNGFSVFDSLIFSEDGKRMENLDNSRLQEFKDFVQHNNGDLYAAKKENGYKLYAPEQFDENKSLKYLIDENSLMYYNDTGTKDLIVDETTLDLLNTMGWNMFNNKEIKIIGKGIDDTGITSAYQNHTFYIKADGMTITNHKWEYKLPLKNGGYEIVATSSEVEFVIPAITNEDKYEHTIEGDICGQIIFEGMADNTSVRSTYNLTLELKPHILKTNIISISPSPRNADYYDVVIDVYYEGCHYVHSTIEEEYSSIVNTAFSDTPYYTRISFTDVDLWGYAWVSITLRNEYGNDNTVIEIQRPESVTYYTSSDIKDIKQNSCNIKIFSPSGIFLGNIKDTDELKNFAKGLLILKFQDEKGHSKILKYMHK